MPRNLKKKIVDIYSKNKTNKNGGKFAENWKKKITKNKICKFKKKL